MVETAYAILKKFPTQSTNIFPIANSRLGGQLLTEFNLKSRESVATDSNVKYTIGPSFVHSLEDYQVSPVAGSDTRLEIAPGRGVIDGHFVELLAPIEVDMTDVNANRTTPLSGNLAIGLKIAYSTIATMAGTIEAEQPVDSNTAETNVYAGVQVVIGPSEGANKLNTPSEVPEDPSKVTVHLLLATFNYNSGNGFIDPSTVENNTDKIRSVDASRLFNLEQELGGRYVENPDTADSSGLYGFASRRKSDSDATPVFGLERFDNCLFEWRNMNTDSVEEGLLDEDPSGTDRSRGKAGAEFVQNASGLYLNVPAKQGYILVNGQQKFRPNLNVPLPEANYVSGSYGVVGPTYTKNVKAINTRINEFYHLVNGKQRAYVDVLIDREDLPRITKSFRVGDYVVVREDQTPTGLDTFEGTGYPSTLYPVVPGIVKSAKYIGKNKISDDTFLVDAIDGTCISTIVSTFEKAPFVEGADGTLKQFYGEFDDNGEPIYGEHDDITDTYMNEFLGIDKSELRGEPMLDEDLIDHDAVDRAQDAVASSMAIYVVAFMTYTAKRSQYILDPTEAKKAAMEEAERAKNAAKQSLHDAQLAYFSLIGLKDYILYRVEKLNEDSEVTSSTTYVFAVKEASSFAYGGPVWLSGPTYPATEDSIGGFQSVNPSILGKGYVHIDDENHLVLNDFSMLMGDILALQLAQGFSIPSGLDPQVVQQELDEYGNDRVAFPKYEVLDQIVSSTALTDDGGIPSYKIEIHLSLPHVEEGQTATINLHNIDSRFGTYIHLYIEGDAESNTILNISDCQKIRIDSNISGTPTINLNNSCLYYDYSVMNRLNRMYGLSLWYERFSADDPRIHVEGLTVYSDVRVRSDSDENVGRRYDTDTNRVNTNDLYYGYNIESVTFSRYGEIIGAGISICNATTANLLASESTIEGFLYKEFVLPQNTTDLQYPVNKVKNVIKIDGSFTTVYKPSSSSKYICIDTIFTANINAVNKVKEVAAGRIGIHYLGKFVTMSLPDASTLAYTQLSDDDVRTYGHSDVTTLHEGVSTKSYHTFRGFSSNNID